MNYKISVIVSLMFFTAEFAYAQTPPKGSFLTKFCLENPQDEFCVRIAKVTAQTKDQIETSSTYRMIRNARMRSSPNTRSNDNIAGQLEQGFVFTPRRRFTNAGYEWFEIELSDGKTVYVATSLARPER